MAKKEESQPRKASIKNLETESRISVIIYTAAAIVMGYASILVSPFTGNILTIFFGLVIAWLVGKLVQLYLGKKEVKWLLGNGLFIYLFVWLIAWIFFFNLLG
jgi:hypothetical protein